MRTLILALLILPIAGLAQKTDTYLKLTDASGQQIKGDAAARGFERCIGVLSFAAAGKNNSQLSFSMSITGAAADLKRAMSSGSLLPNGILTVTQPSGGGAPAISYTIKMENIRVNSCSESMGCNGVMTSTAVISATRIGWTYYQTDNTGKSTVSRKYGFDNETGKEWTNF
jgi:type VI protein secretion system component Hcp